MVVISDAMYNRLKTEHLTRDSARARIQEMLSIYVTEKMILIEEFWVSSLRVRVGEVH